MRALVALFLLLSCPAHAGPSRLTEYEVRQLEERVTASELAALNLSSRVHDLEKQIKAMERQSLMDMIDPPIPKIIKRLETIESILIQRSLPPLL